MRWKNILDKSENTKKSKLFTAVIISMLLLSGMAVFAGFASPSGETVQTGDIDSDNSLTSESSGSTSDATHLSFDGVGDYVNVSDASNIRISDSTTITARVNADDRSGAPQGILSKGKYSLKEYDDDYIFEVIGDNSGASWSKSGDVGNGPRGLAVYDGKLYTACYGPNEVHVFDGTSWSKSGDVGGDPFGLAVYDGKLYTACYGSDEVHVFDGTSWSKSGDVGTDPHGLAVYDGELYVSNYDSDDVYVYGNGTSVWASKGSGFEHLAGVISSSEIKLYKDGSLISSPSYSFPLANSTDNLYIGKAYGSSQSGYYKGNDELFKGNISDVKFYNRSLSDSEISDLSGGTIITENLTSHWDFSEGSGSTLYDRADGNDGTIYNATWNDIYIEKPRTAKSVYEIGESLNISFNTTSDSRENISRTYLSLQDPTGVDRIDNASTLEFSDTFGDGDYTDKWNSTSTEYSESSGKLKFGYSGTAYKEGIFVNGSRLDDKKDLSASMDFNTLTDAEHTSRIITRYQDSDNYVALYVSHYYSAFGIEEISGGTRYNTETSKPTTTNTEYDLKLTIQDGTAKGYLNGDQIISRDLQYVTSAGRTGISTDASEVTYDNFTVGYSNSSLSQIDKGYQSNYSYVIPNNTSLGGTWTITAKADNRTGSTYSSTGTFTVATDKPFLQNESILNTNANKYAGYELAPQIYATHSTPSELNYNNITITAPNGTVMVDNKSGTEISSHSTSKQYEYRYTPPQKLSSEGTWTYRWWVNDTSGNDWDEFTGTFFVDVPAPEFSNFHSHLKTDVNDTKIILSHKENVTYNLTVTDQDDNLQYTNITIQKSNGSYLIQEKPMESNGTTYFLNESTLDEGWNQGIWNITVKAVDGNYTTYYNTSRILYWQNSSFANRKKVNITDHFSSSRTENVGVNFTVPSDEYGYKIYDIWGNDVEMEHRGNVTYDGNIHYNAQLKASSSKEYYVYYDKNQPLPTTTLQGTSTAVQQTDHQYISTSEFFDPSNITDSEKITYTKSIESGDPDGDGDAERVIVGKTVNESFHSHGFMYIVDEDGNKEFSTRQLYKDEMGWYSVEIENVDETNDGLEIVIGGWAFDEGLGYNYGIVGTYRYNGTGLKELDNYTFSINSDDTDVFAINVHDIDGSSPPEIMCGGRAVGGGDSHLRILRVDTDGSIISLGSQSTGFGNERDRMFAIKTGDLLGTGSPRIVTAGTTKLPYENHEGGLLLNATICTWEYDAGIIQHMAYSYNITVNGEGDLTEIFSIDVEDIDADGKDEIISSGNYYDWPNGRDIADLRIWNYSEDATEDGSVSLQHNVTYPSNGHSSILSVEANDIDNDHQCEVVGTGFQNWQTDEGLMVIAKYNETHGFTKTYNNSWLIGDKPTRDGDYFDAMTITDMDDNGVKEVTSGGRYGMTAPAKTFFREVEISGLTSQTQDSESYQKPIEKIRYRAYNNSVQDQTSFDSGKMKINTSANAKFAELNFTTYHNFNNSKPTCMEWFETAPSGTDINYTINVSEYDQSFLSSLILRRFNDTTSSWDSVQTLDASDGWLNFTTANHSTNELQILGNTPPSINNVAPSDGATGLSTTPTLTADVSDDDGDLMNVTFYNASDDSEIAKNTNIGNGTTSVTWSGLSSGTTYNWYAIADDGNSTNQFSTWSFTTNYEPTASNPDPSDGSKIAETTSTTLSVDVSDGDADTMDVTFWNSTAPSANPIDTNTKVASGSTTSVTWSGLNPGNSYDWEVTMDDGTYNVTSTAWSFTINQESTASNPVPSDGETIANTTSTTLTVNVSDPDGDTMNVTFFNATNDSPIGTNTGVSNGTTSVTWSGLSPGNTYEWYVTTDDGTDNITSSTWSFTINRDPKVSNPSPADEATKVSMPVTLSVNVSDPDGDSLDVTFYNASNDSMIGIDTGVSSGSRASITWSGLSDATTYEWYVNVTDELNTTTSSTWNFTTIREFTLTIKIDGQGSTSPSKGTYTYENGTSVTITQEADLGWKFKKWTGDTSTTDENLTLTMDENKTVTANFEEKDASDLLQYMVPIVALFLLAIFIGKMFTFIKEELGLLDDL